MPICDKIKDEQYKEKLLEAEVRYYEALERLGYIENMPIHVVRRRALESIAHGKHYNVCKNSRL